MLRYLMATVALTTPALADPGNYGHMTGWGYGVGMMFGPVLWLVVLGLVVAGVIWFVRNAEGTASKSGKSDALAALDMRLARGEIDADDYATRKKLLGG